MAAVLGRGRWPGSARNRFGPTPTAIRMLLAWLQAFGEISKIAGAKGRGRYGGRHRSSPRPSRGPRR